MKQSVRFVPSVVSSPIPGDNRDFVRDLVLQQVADGSLTVQLAEARLREISAKIDAAVTAAELPLQAIREQCGPELHGLPAHLATMLNMGAGYARHCQAILRALHRARNSAKRKAAKS